MTASMLATDHLATTELPPKWQRCKLTAGCTVERLVYGLDRMPASRDGSLGAGTRSLRT